MTLALDRLDDWSNKVAVSSAPLIKQIADYLPEHGTLLDIGANVGAVTAGIQKLKPCKAVLFEPIPELASYCVRQLGAQAQVFCEALGDREGSAILYLGYASCNYGWNTLIKEQTSPDMPPLEVRMTTLDQHLREHLLDRIDAIKLDTEGYEFAVLRGAHETLLRFHPAIFCEIAWGAAKHPNWKEECEQFEWLMANGYQKFDYNVSRTEDRVILPL